MLLRRIATHNCAVYVGGRRLSADSRRRFFFTPSLSYIYIYIYIQSHSYLTCETRGFFSSYPCPPSATLSYYFVPCVSHCRTQPLFGLSSLPLISLVVSFLFPFPRRLPSRVALLFHCRRRRRRRHHRCCCPFSRFNVKV